MLYKIIKNHSYKLVIYALIIFLLLILYLGNHNLIEGNTCNESKESLASSTLLNIINCSDSNYEISTISAFTDISSICSNNLEDTINNVNNAGGLGNQASDLYNSSGQLLSNAANAQGNC